MDEQISKKAALVAVKDALIAWSYMPEWRDEKILEAIAELPPALSTNLAEVGTDCISRQAAIDAIDKCYCGGEDSCGEPWVYKENAVEAIQMIEPIPSAEPKRGKWISADAIFGGVPFYCSECGENTWDTVMGKPRANFCPNCGADMREETT